MGQSGNVEVAAVDGYVDGGNLSSLVLKTEAAIDEKLTADGIIFNKRGIGYFVSADAKSIILAAQRKAFLEEELPCILRKMALLDIDPAVLTMKQD